MYPLPVWSLTEYWYFFLAQVAGYACSVDFSPEMSYLISGDADGKLYIWDWKTTKLYSKFKAHDDVCISALWHPHETSKIATAGWDGVIKYWDWENQPKDKYFIVIKCRKFFILWIFHMYPVMLLKILLNSHKEACDGSARKENNICGCNWYVSSFH